MVFGSWFFCLILANNNGKICVNTCNNITMRFLGNTYTKNSENWLNVSCLCLFFFLKSTIQYLSLGNQGHKKRHIQLTKVRVFSAYKFRSIVFIFISFYIRKTIWLVKKQSNRVRCFLFLFGFWWGFWEMGYWYS